MRSFRTPAIHRLVALVGTAALAACADAVAPTAEPAQATRPSLSVSDAANGGGTAGFYFLAPLVVAPTTFAGTFDAAAAPTVRICAPVATCATPLATFEVGSQAAPVTVDGAKQTYTATWASPATLTLGRDQYRVEVWAAGVKLGHVDLEVVGTPAQLRTVGAGYAGLVRGTALSVRFRIETRVVAAVDVSGAPASLDVAGAATLAATVRDLHGTAVAGAPVTWASSAAGVATVDGNGVVTGVSAGTATIAATSSGRTGSTTVTVVDCRDLPVGGTFSTSGASASSICLAGGAETREYTAMPLNTNFGVNAGVSLTANATGIQAVTGPPAAMLAGDVEGAAGLAPLDGRMRMAIEASDYDILTADPMRDGLARGALIGAGRRSARGAARSSLDATSATIVPGVPALDAKMTLNVAQGCNGAVDNRTGTVRSIGQKAIIVTDDENPAGGFTTVQYDSIAAEFDTLAYPTVTANFGQPTDEDENGRVVLFYTRAVNELSPPASSVVTLGYFAWRDLYAVGSCARSNEGEILYMMVPDPTGVVNSNVRTVSMVRGQAIGTAAHELQHLVNASRRLWVVGGPLEEPWLDEGLSHIAEELLFYRTSVGLAPRQNIVTTQLTTGPNATRRVAAFNTYANPNYGRLRSWLQRPDTSGITRIAGGANSSNLAARGALWAFLRYSADRRNGSDAAFWSSLVNTTGTGRGNLSAALGGIDVGTWLHDWVTAMYTDDAVAGVDAKYTNPSWNYRSLYTALNTSYQLGTRPLTNGVDLTLAIANGGSAYYRFGTAAGQKATLAFRSGAAAPPATMSFMIVRTK